jgi:hypothetical protein
LALRNCKQKRVANHVREVNLPIRRVEGPHLLKLFSVLPHHRRRAEEHVVRPLNLLLVGLEGAVARQRGRGRRVQLHENAIAVMLQNDVDLKVLERGRVQVDLLCRRSQLQVVNPRRKGGNVDRQHDAANQVVKSARWRSFGMERRTTGFPRLPALTGKSPPAATVRVPSHGRRPLPRETLFNTATP